jgi:biopolymer transport protein TolR
MRASPQRGHMRAHRAKLTNEINVTPFLDVLLVLLVIFLASLQARKTLDVTLPQPSTSDCSQACESIVLEVLPNGVFALNRAQFARADLLPRVQRAFAGRPASILFVKGDPSVRYQEVVSAIDVARGAGVKVVAIAPKQTR